MKRSSMTNIAKIEEARLAEEKRKTEEAEAKRVRAQEKRKEARELRAAAKKVASEVAKRPDPKPEAAKPPSNTVRPELQAALDEAFTLPYEPPSYHFGPNDDPFAELAQRELCRRKLLPFIQRFRPKYMAGWVHEDICRRIERFVEQVERGESPRLLLMMPPRSGKLLADDTLVPTPRGYRFHGDLVPGDEVFHPSGKAVTVVAVSQKDVADVRVTFSDGSSYLCHENHEWTLFDRKRGEWKTLEAGHFLRPSHLGTVPKLLNNTRAIYQLPVVAPLEYRNSVYTMHPYTLGAWLGDGSAGKPCITGDKRDKAVIDKIESLGYPVSTVCEHKTTGVLTTYFSGPKPNNAGRMTLELQGLGIYKQKRIPLEYQHLRTDLRLELLAGLIDTDGTTDAQSRISITTVSYELADDIMQLCEGLGLRPYMQEVQPTLSSSGIQGKKVCYVVGFQPTMKIPVALERKRVTRIAQQRRVGLASVERVAQGAAKLGHCIQVNSPDGLYVVGKQLTTTHNSEISSRHTPAWILGQHPDWEIIAGSHTSSLSLSFSRYLRDVMRDPAYTAVFPDAILDPSSQSVENWNLTRGGGYLAAGVGTGITGRGCLAPYTLVDTNRGKIRIVDLKVGDSVYGYDHEQEKVVTTRVQALQITERRKSLLDCGDVRLTTDHRIYNAARGFYTRSGESPRLLGLRREEGSTRCDVQSVLFQSADRGDHSAQMRLLWEELHAQRSGASEVQGSTRRGSEGVLQSPMLRPVQDQQPCGVQQGEGGVPALQEACHRDGSFQVLQQGLLQRVQGFETADGCVQWRVSDAEEAGAAAGREVHAVRYDPRSVRGASHQPGRGRQPDFESGAALCGVPPQISSVHGTCAADIAELFEPFDFVVDIQTGTSNFFTEGLLVHNCHVLLLDDLVKDIEAADSLTIRDNTWEWYLSTAYTRLAPGGGVLGLMTWWHSDDWAGRIQEAMAVDEGADQFEIIRYPAINEYGDEYILPDDSIVQIPHGNPVPEGSRLTRPINTAVHPARYTTEMMLKIKRNLISGGQKRVWDALYQQNPVPDEGNYFSKEMFRYYGSPPRREDLYVYQAWDFAISEGKDSDYTVGTCIGVDHRDNVYYLGQRRFRIQDGGFIIDAILDFAQEYDADCLGFEDGQIWKSIEFQFDKRCRERRQYPSFELLKPLTDKMVRANPLRGRMQLGKVYFDNNAPYWTELQKEMLHFPAGKHDDQIDSLAWAVRLTLSRSAPREKRVEPKAKSWKEKLQLGGVGGSHMAA